MPIEIRSALPPDAETIIGIHFAAVRQTAADSYPVEVIESWSTSPSEDRYARVRTAIATGKELFVVAEMNGDAVGFGSIVPAQRELRAVYVHPSAGRHGIGTAILRRLEMMAVECGVEQLQMDASINAERFYRNNGYVVVERGFHQLRSGVQMACVRMKKLLLDSDRRAEKSK